MQDLGCAPALCSVHFALWEYGREHQKDAGTGEYPKIFVIEISSCKVRPM
jgi:hypothetical protein